MNRTSIIALLGTALLCWPVFEAQAGGREVHVQTLLEADETILGEAFEYPEGQAKITVAVITIPRGVSLALHEHPVPLTAVIIQGTLEVNYPGVGKIRYRPGDTFVEAFNTPHSGRNAGWLPVKILAMYSGAEGVPNSVTVE